VAGLVWVVGLAALTWQQLPVWQDAEAVWRRALEVDPDCAFCHGQAGALAGNRGDLVTAIADFERVVELRPRNVRHRSNLGLALLKAARPAEAAAQFERILAREPTDAETRTRLGLALAQQGRLADASREFERASRDDPRSAGALTQLGISLIELGRPSEAIPYLESAARLDPASPIVRAALSRAHGASAR
jgi:superkiller protein 3